MDSFQAFLSMSEEVVNELTVHQAELTKTRHALNAELADIQALLEENQNAFLEVEARLKALRALRSAK